MSKIGADCRLYRNTGTYDAPVWNQIELVKDLTQNLEKGDADVSNRGSGGWRVRVGTLKDGNLEFDLVWQSGDADFEALRDAFLNNTLIDLVALDGPITTPGTQGLRAEMSVLSFTREEPLDGAVMASVNVAPGSVTRAPVWYIAGAEPPTTTTDEAPTTTTAG